MRVSALTNASALAPKALTNSAPAVVSRIPNTRIPTLELLTNDCVVFLGGTSVVGDARYAFLETLLTRRFPGRHLRFRNLGWEGDTVFGQERPLNFPNLIRSVKDQRATVVFANFGLMESLRGVEGLTEFSRAYGALLDQLTNITDRVVVLSPFRREMIGRSSQEVAEANKNLDAYVRATRNLAEQRGLIFVDLFKLQNRDPASAEAMTLTCDGLHPSAYGYWRAAHEIERSLGLTPEEWSIEVDARNRSYQAKGAKVLDFQVSTSTVSFRTLDEALPGSAFPRNDGGLSVWGSRTVKVSGLLPGRYILLIDGVPLYDQSQLFWERGRVLTHGPEVRQTEALREAIVQKNAAFFNYWRPQNWAFLDGDLTSQPSSHRHDNFAIRWFPGEMQDFPPLLTKQEAQIEKLARPGFHTYELRRVE